MILSRESLLSDKENIFNQIPDLQYQEELFAGDPKAFEKIIQSRRSVRQYGEQKIPEEVMQQVLDWALMAPNSSNLQCWEFIWVKSPEKKAQLAKYCFDQPAARTAQELVVAVARPTWWKKNAQQMLEVFKAQEQAGEVVPRQPTSHEQLKKWAVKSCALACQNFMMGMSAHGFDTCPMEGFDESKVKKILGIGRKDEITMVISCGKRASSGVYGPRIRFPREKFIKII